LNAIMSFHQLFGRLTPYMRNVSGTLFSSGASETFAVRPGRKRFPS
jgi:hypothetical protein